MLGELDWGRSSQTALSQVDGCRSQFNSLRFEQSLDLVVENHPKEVTLFQRPIAVTELLTDCQEQLAVRTHRVGHRRWAGCELGVSMGDLGKLADRVES